MTDASPGSKKWIAFDAAGTLFETAEPVEKIYADCFATLGFGIPEATWKTAFKKAFELTPDPIHTDRGNGESLEKKWWRDLVKRAADATGIRPDAGTMSHAFEELFEHYAAGSAWRLFPETEAVLLSLKSEGIGLAVVSNFDSRLRRVLEELAISDFFEFTLTSADVGARKPSPAILLKVLELAETNPADCCLAGDSPEADGGAANAAGIAFFHVNRPHTDLTDFRKWHSSRFFRK